MSVTADIVTRTIGHPWLWLQEVTSTLFIYAIFIGAAVATRRNDHLYLTAISEAMHGTLRLIVEIVIRLVVLGVAVCLIWFGYLNYLRGFGSFRLPSGTPIASLYAVIPLSGALIALFTDRAARQRHRATASIIPSRRKRISTSCRSTRIAEPEGAAVSAPVILALMSFCFLFFGYLGVPVPFSLLAGVFVGALLADVSLAAIIQKIFDGVDSEALLAIPFFLLVGELMSSANVVVRIANLSLSLVGHIRGGLSQVVVVFSMFFSEMSGSTTADVAVMSRALGGPMRREGYSARLHRGDHRRRLHHRRAGAAEHHRGGLWRGRQCLDRRPVHGRRGAGLHDRLRADDLLLFLRPLGHAQAARAAAAGRVRGRATPRCR